MFLCEDAGNHAGQDVSRTTSRHTGITRGIDIDRAVRRGNRCPVALQDHICVSLLCKIGCDVDAIGCHAFDTFADQASHLTRMWREYGAAEIAFETHKRIQPIRINDHLGAAFRTHAANEGAREALLL